MTTDHLTERMKRRLDPTRPGIMFAESFDVLIDANPKGGLEPALAIQVDTGKGQKPIIIPMAYKSAKELALLMLQTLMVAAPEMFLADGLEDE
ncbi:MAG: hypothetical protein ACLQLO_20030 [Mycobacterium sp.]